MATLNPDCSFQLYFLNDPYVFWIYPLYHVDMTCISSDIPINKRWVTFLVSRDIIIEECQCEVDIILIRSKYENHSAFVLL
jgi:hypothetical protein